jgi:hypothetical protein
VVGGVDADGKEKFCVPIYTSIYLISLYIFAGEHIDELQLGDM